MTPTKGLDKGSFIAGKYRIVEKLGEGGMGVVYKAEDTRLKRTVALKFLPPDLTGDPEAKERFFREAQAAAALSHPNICTIHEIDEEEGEAFIAMEYIEGQSLQERVKKEPLDLQEALEIAIQAAKGLNEAHKKGIIHRDIKPGNIMLTTKGQAKVMDFGLAKMLGESLITREAKTMGTVAYMSPEQVRGEPVDHRTDIWSFGVVLYEIISGELPFKGEKDASLMYSIVHEEQMPIKSIRPDIPAEFERIINLALKKDPDFRYQSPTEMLKDLINYQDILKAEEAGVFNIRSFLRRIRKPRIAIPVVLTMLAICIAFIWYLNRSAKIRWVRMQAIPEINRHTEEGNYLAAFQLAQKAEKIIPDDRMLTSFWPQTSREFSWKTDPPGAALYIRELKEPEGSWEYLGQLSGQKIRIPKGNYQAKLEKEGSETIECLFFTERAESFFRLKLNQIGSLPPFMSVVPAGEQFVELNLYNYDRLLSYQIDEFLIDKNEVTNREFKEFLDKCGYERREYWKHEFVKDGRTLSWEKAMEAFLDQTGRPGPSTWQFGTYPEGQADYPVTGVSWYEAMAYAEFANKRLPTIYHWDRAAHLGYSSGLIVPRSNFGSSGLAPVGSYSGSLGIYGTYDMTGNAREWCSNATGDMKFTLGGAWNDPTYFAVEPNVKTPFDRSPENGFRCIKLTGELFCIQSSRELMKEAVVRAKKSIKFQPRYYLRKT